MRPDALVAATLDELAPPAAQAFVRELLARHGAEVAAVLFYGSCRRDGGTAGLLDLYVLYDRHRPFHAGPLGAALTAALPPHIVFLDTGTDGTPVSAKVAALSCRQFERRTALRSLDTTIWARFSQPASLLYARDDATRRLVVRAVSRAVETAATWALRLAPPDVDPASDPARCWQLLFARTYGAELRPERRNRPAMIHSAAPGWFDRALAERRAALSAAGQLPAGRWRRRRWAAAWLLRRVWGRPLNVLRLVKAAFTAENGTAYALAKLERHGHARVVPTAWQRRHPLLAAPVLLWRVRSGR